MAEAVRILSIDGGGIRGIIPAMVLQWIEGTTGKRISEMFHMVADTSTGGLLACGLVTPARGSEPRSATEMVDLYRNRGGEIFHSSFWKGFGSLCGIADEKYDAEALEKILKKYFGEAKLSQVAKDLLVTSYNIETRRPFFFKSWKARGEKLDNDETAADRDFLIRDLCRATSAAPTYFEPRGVKKLIRTNTSFQVDMIETLLHLGRWMKIARTVDWT